MREGCCIDWKIFAGETKGASAAGGFSFFSLLPWKRVDEKQLFGKTPFLCSYSLDLDGTSSEFTVAITKENFSW